MCVRARRVEEDNIIAHISSIIEKGIDNFTEEDQLKLTESQNKLDEIYRRKAEGAFVRSRKKWLVSRCTQQRGTRTRRRGLKLK